MKKIILTTSILLVLSTYFNVSIARGTASSSVVASIGFGPYYDNYCNSTSCVFVAVDPPPTQVQGDCANYSTGWHFVIDTSNDTGKQSLSALLTAHSTGRRISIEGSGYCKTANSGKTEDLYFLILKK
ncbi:MAG: hypothetical protein OEY38_19440 [Gammaproteobacteria bacterium]|nr:hypothetical protein [Gammaproteobacteria bacterium]